MSFVDERHLVIHNDFAVGLDYFGLGQDPSEHRNRRFCPLLEGNVEQEGECNHHRLEEQNHPEEPSKDDRECYTGFRSCRDKVVQSYSIWKPTEPIDYGKQNCDPCVVVGDEEGLDVMCRDDDEHDHQGHSPEVICCSFSEEEVGRECFKRDSNREDCG